MVSTSRRRESSPASRSKASRWPLRGRGPTCCQRSGSIAIPATLPRPAVFVPLQFPKHFHAIKVRSSNVNMRIPTLLSITIAFSLTLVAASPGEKYKFVAKWGGEAPPGTLNLPGKVAVDADGNIFVADQGNNRIEKFDQTGKFLLQWGKLGSQGGEFSDPSSAAVDASGNVFVADYYNSRIQEFTNNGVFIKAWGGPGSR